MSMHCCGLATALERLNDIRLLACDADAVTTTVRVCDASSYSCLCVRSVASVRPIRTVRRINVGIDNHKTMRSVIMASH